MPWADVDAAIEAAAETAFAFLERLVTEPSTVGAERGAQDIVAAELAGLGFTVSELAIPDETADGAPAGVAQGPYAGRPNVLGRLNPGGGPALLLNGHVDVVPAEAELWESDPFTPVRSGGWLTGRGAGDMKGGFALGLLAVAGLQRAMPGALAGELSFLSVIEEECTGNGTLAACQAGVLADAVIVLEPTDLDVLLGGVGVLWIEIEITGVPAHAESADRAQNPIRSVPAILRALARFEDTLNGDTAHDPGFAGIARPYNVNPGIVWAGDWASSVPGRARLGVRVGFPRAWSPDEAFTRVSAAVLEAGAEDQWLADHPPAIRPTGFRAEGHLLPARHWLAEAMARAHEAATGSPPELAAIGATTDARYYLNQFSTPALAYGPRARNIHALGEAVDLASIVTGAKALARFIAAFYAGQVIPA
ncbi:MAG TPA: M20/M25/M40 family metallo-hydrolase [Streptosporangiaceae bacterium]|nr:M20/M25/M40 family metallo-hydrolase [Streptosporangiaceae bacterium]